jgi:hypothetical protein
MSTANTAAQNKRANDWAVDFAAATLTILVGATVVATHTLTGFGAGAVAGVLTAAIPANATIGAGGGTATAAKLTSGALVYDLTLGTSGTDVVVSTTNYIDGQTSSITSLTVTFPA